jgi:hypothetical protein
LREDGHWTINSRKQGAIVVPQTRKRLQGRKYYTIFVINSLSEDLNSLYSSKITVCKGLHSAMY